MRYARYLRNQIINKTYVIADIHGCCRTFRHLLFEVIRLKKEDTLYLLGDYIDRGPESKGVIETIMALQADEYNILRIDETTMRACEPLPRCVVCDKVCRPNILMFGDNLWLHGRTLKQNQAFDRFLKKNSSRRMAVIELGAGTAIPTIRMTSERIGRKKNATVIRINPREPSINHPHVSMSCGALAGLKQIDELFLKRKRDHYANANRAHYSGPRNPDNSLRW